MYHQQQQLPQQQYQQPHGNQGMHQQQHPIRNRIYVGGIPQTASQDELRDYFAYFGSIKDARIIMDTVGNSKGYGFVTYDNESDAMKVLDQRGQDFIFKESKLNIGQAFRQNNQQQQNNFGGPNNFNRMPNQNNFNNFQRRNQRFN